MISPRNTGFSYKKSIDSIAAFPVVDIEIKREDRPRRRLKTFEMITKMYLEGLEERENNTVEDFKCNRKLNYENVDNEQYNLFDTNTSQTQTTLDDIDECSRSRFMSA